MSVIRNRRQFTKEFKYQVIREVESGKPMAQVAREHELHLQRRKRHRGI
jgi:transposase-like protein